MSKYVQKNSLYRVFIETSSILINKNKQVRWSGSPLNPHLDHITVHCLFCQQDEFNIDKNPRIEFASDMFYWITIASWGYPKCPDNESSRSFLNTEYFTASTAVRRLFWAEQLNVHCTSYATNITCIQRWRHGWVFSLMRHIWNMENYKYIQLSTNQRYSLHILSLFIGILYGSLLADFGHDSVGNG